MTPIIRSRGVRIPLLLLPALLAVSACSGTATASASRGGTMVIAIGQDAVSLNPLVAGDVWSVRAYTPLYPLLYQAQADLTVTPDLASGYPTVSAGGLTWTVPLRRASWSDGRPITAADVVFTIGAERNPALDTETSFDWSPLASVSALDAHTLQFTLKRPDAAFLANQLVTPVVPQHALQDVPPNQMSTALFSTQPPVSGGPLRLRSRVLGQELDFEPNPHYYGPRPNLDAVVMRVITDYRAIGDGLAQGQVLWAPDMGATSTTLKGLTGVSVASFVEPGHESLVFNLRAGRPFAAPATRRAAAAAVDHVEAANLGGGRAVWSGVDPVSWAYSAPPGAGAPASVARTLDGVSATIAFPREDDARRQASAALYAELSYAGARIKLEAVPEATLRDRLQHGDFDAAMVSFGDGIDADQTRALDSSSWPERDPAGLNYGDYSDPQVDRLLAAERMADPGPQGRPGRRADFAGLESALAADPPAVPLWAPVRYDGLNSVLKGLGQPGPQLDHDLQASFYARLYEVS